MKYKIILTLAVLIACPRTFADDAGLVDRAMERFGNSELKFRRSDSNVPFFPVALLGATAYGDAEVETADGRDLTYDVDTFSQAAGIPFLLGSRDMLVVGEYISYSDFSVEGGDVDDFGVTSFGLPVGWVRQINDDWQAAAFVMPLGHDSDLNDSGWNWQTLGGGFARWEQRDDLWWAFGLYFDVGGDDDFVIPYLGASWEINQRWTVSAVMPWPAVLYAPTPDWLFRLGVSPSGASWSIEPEDGDAYVNIDSWDFGLGVERRFFRHFWAGIEAGWGGFRGLRLSDDGTDSIDLDVGSSGYVNVSLTLRPSLIHP